MVEKAINPIYTTERPNSSINIYNGDLELKAPAIISSRGSVEFRWQPSISLRFKMDPIIFSPTLFNVPPGNYAILNIPTVPPMNYDVIITRRGLRENEGDVPTIQFAGIASENRWSDVLCDEIKFHVVNMSEHIGSVITYHSDRSLFARRIALSDEDWETTIDGTENIDELTEGLRQDGGFAITHAGILRHRGGLPFKIKEGIQQLEVLGLFLSFTEGRSCRPVLLVGTRNREIVFRDFLVNTRIDPWKGNWSWNPMEARYLDDAYKGFILRWKDPKWRRPIPIIIELYIRANTYPTIELSIVDSFTALDFLASACFPGISEQSSVVKLSRILSKGGLNNQTLPMDLYSYYNSFYRKYCPSDKKADAATIITDFRNGVVHGNKSIRPGKMENRPKIYDDGDRSNPPVPSSIKREARQLALWCVEMSLLRLFGYKGHYNDRLSRAQQIPMPS